MNNNKIPPTPFSTRLSRRGREAEHRLRRIVSGPGKRPPVVFLAAVFAACLLCGNLVSCQVVQAGGPERSEPPASSQSMLPPEEWLAGTLRNWVVPECVMDEPFQWLTQEEAALLQSIPADELPREPVELYPGPLRGEFWRDMLLPVAADEGADVTVYFVFGGMPQGTDWDVSLQVWGSKHLQRDGIVLRYGDRTAYFPLCWETNAKYSKNPLLAVEDFDGDGQPEAMLTLAWGDGTGCYVESLYIFDLDTMTYTLPDYSNIPLQMSYAPDRTLARLTSGDQELEVDIEPWLIDRFQGEMEAGNQVSFDLREGQMYCRLTFDFSCDTLGYLAWADFPVVYEDGSYRLAEAEVISNEYNEY